MMQKKLISLAIAAAMAAPAAAMAEATLYGKLHVSLDYADVKNVGSLGTDLDGVPYERYYANPNVTLPDGRLAPAGPGVIYLDEFGNPIVRGGKKFTGWGMSANGYIPGAGRANRIGVKGSEDLGNGLKAIYQVEFGINLNDTNNRLISNSDAITYRNTFVGLAGNWGTALVGRHDTPLKISTGRLDLFADTMADYNGTVGFQDLRVDNVVAYISPSFGGFSFAGAIVPGGGSSGTSGLNINEDSISGAYSLAAIFNNGPFYASVAYESLDQDMFMNSQTSLRGSAACVDQTTGLPTESCNYVGDDFAKWRVGLGILDWNGFTLTGIYENQDKVPAGQVRQGLTIVSADGTISDGSLSGFRKQDLWQIQAAYAFGNNQIKAMYGSVNRDSGRAFAQTRETLSITNFKGDIEGDRYTWAVGFDHNFSKRTKAYVLYTAVDDDLNGVPSSFNQDNDGVDWSGFSLGLVHKF
jgi:predicted porin